MANKKLIKLNTATKEELYEQYIEENLTLSQMAEIYDCSEQTISIHLKKHNIRKSKDAIAENISKGLTKN